MTTYTETYTWKVLILKLVSWLHSICKILVLCSCCHTNSTACSKHCLFTSLVHVEAYKYLRAEFGMPSSNYLRETFFEATSSPVWMKEIIIRGQQSHYGQACMMLLTHLNVLYFQLYSVSSLPYPLQDVVVRHHALWCLHTEVGLLWETSARDCTGLSCQILYWSSS